MIIGAQGYTIRDYCQDEQGIAKSLGRLKGIGFHTLQVSAFGQIAPERLKALAEENGLEIVITHTNPELILTKTEKVIEAHRAMGCRNVGIGMMPKKYLDMGGLAGVKAFLSDFARPARRIAEAGMRLHYHNHYYEYQKEDGKLLLDYMAENTDPEEWGFILDVFWTQYGGRCPAQQIKQLAGRIEVLHLKDMKIVGQERRMAAVMEGNLSWPEILAACEEAKVPYGMIEQDDTYGLDPFDELKRSHDNLAKAGMKF